VATEGAHGYAPAAERPPGVLRVGVSTKPVVAARVHPVVKRVVAATADLFRSLGHEVEEADPDYPLVNPALIRWYAGVAEDVARAPLPERFQRRTRGWARLGRAIAPPVLSWARQEDNSERMRPLFERHDVLLTPTIALPPVRAGKWEGVGPIRTALGQGAMSGGFCSEWNLTGQPAISVPGEVSDHGLPIGVQLVGRPNDEATLISLAAQLESELHWPDRRPPVA